MGHPSRADVDQALSFARTIAPSMLAAAEQNSGVSSAELPLPTFVSIAHALRCLSDAVEDAEPARATLVASASAAAAGGPSRDQWIATLSAVPTMGGDSLADLLAPSEIAEIVEAVIAAQARPVQVAAPKEDGRLPEDFLDRLFASYAREAD